MEEIDMDNAIKRVCRKRVNESTRESNPRGDAVLVSDDGAAESNVFSVECVSMDSSGEDPMVPVTPCSKFEGVDYLLGVDDSPLPLGIPNQELLDCDYKCKGGGGLKRDCDYPSLPALLNQELLDCDYKCKGGGSFKRECDSRSPFLSTNQKLRRECDSRSPFLSTNQQLLDCDSQLKDGAFCSEDDPCTPKKNVFDPFAPGPDKLNLAPYCRKYIGKSQLSVVRKLRFDMCTEFDSNSEDLAVSEEEIVFQSVYSDILEVIISTQTKENEKVPCELSLPDGLRTPIAATRLSGVPATCPGAPVKIRSPRKFRRINKKVNRRLDF